GNIDWTALEEPPDHHGEGDDSVDPDHADLTTLWAAGFDHLPTSRPPTTPPPPHHQSPGNEPEHPGPSPTNTDTHGDTPDRTPPRPPQPQATPPAGPTPPPVPAGALPGPRRGVVDLQISLTTLIGLTNHPGELAGFGPVIADIARHVVAENPDLTWRYSVYDETGILMSHGITRRRPTAHDAAYINARDRTCRAPGCRMPAHRCEIDHTADWAKTRNTSRANLANLCSRDHHFKHLPGTDLIQLDDGILAWKTPLGQHITTHPPTYFDN
ncbi:HNH endonuclease signature motif containing protein, partial [Actinomycetes bacterium KLBMP 9797]